MSAFLAHAGCSRALALTTAFCTHLPPLRRLLVTLQDESAILLQGSEVLWRREEALAHGVSTLFVDLPAPSPQLEAEYSARLPSLAERMALQLKSLKVPPTRLG